MAARPDPSSGSGSATAAADLLELLRRLRSLGVAGDDHHHGLSHAFERVLSLFFSQVLHREAPTLPAIVGEGAAVDLFALYSASRRHPDNWPRVASALALRNPGALRLLSSPSAALKLVYSKYLSDFHRWLSLALGRQIAPAEPVAQCGGPVAKLDLLRPASTDREEEDEAPEAVVVVDGRKATVDVSKMLRWLRAVARSVNIDGGRAKRSPEFQEVLKARRALVVKRSVRIGLGSLLSQRGHPSMYDDGNGPYPSGDENLRYSRRIHNKRSSDDLENPNPKRLKKSSPGDSSGGSSQESSSDEDPSPRRRAKVPCWTGGKSTHETSDSKWLGTRIWPPESKKGKALPPDQVSIGKGRQDSCTCQLPGSVECIRFHVAENRLSLKLQLGKLFYDWKFHQMGEEISLSWTAEEEEKFKSIVHQTPKDVSFWPQVFRSLPSKSPRSLASYYFNVFLLRKRSYQNRLIPTNIDSDDEEGEFGFVCSILGGDAVQVHAPIKVVCAENTQVVDIDSDSDDNR